MPGASRTGLPCGSPTLTCAATGSPWPFHAGTPVRQLKSSSVLRGLEGRTPALRLAYAMHPNPAQGATVARTATLGHPIADRNAVYVADTRARYGHTVHLAREDLGIDGTDADRLDRYAAAISESHARSSSLAYGLDRRRIASYREMEL